MTDFLVQVVKTARVVVPPWSKDTGHPDSRLFPVINEISAILTSRWKMNKASGVINKELWVLQENGKAKLREDDFEAVG